MGALDPEKLLVVFVIALIILGPDKLPRVARQLGAAWRELTKFRYKVEQEVRSALPDVDLPRIPTRPSSAVAGFISDLTGPVKASLREPLAATGGGAASGGAKRDEKSATTADAVPETGGAGAAGPMVRTTAPAAGSDASDRVAVSIDDPSMN